MSRYHTDQGVTALNIWVRGQWSSAAALLQDGSRIQHEIGGWAKAAEIGARITSGSPALVHQCRQEKMGLSGDGSIMIRRPCVTAAGHDLIEQQQAYQVAYGKALNGGYLAKEFFQGQHSTRGTQIRFMSTLIHHALCWRTGGGMTPNLR